MSVAELSRQPVYCRDDDDVDWYVRGAELEWDDPSSLDVLVVSAPPAGVVYCRDDRGPRVRARVPVPVPRPVSPSTQTG